MMLFPPRAEHRVTETMIKEFPAPTWLAQCKFNGTALIILCDEGRINTMNRHGKIYSTNIKESEYRAIFPKTGTFVVCGEYLNKGQADEFGVILKDKFIIWDITNFNGEDLIGHTVEQRIDIILKNTKRAKASTRPYIHKELSENVWVARSFYNKFEEVFKLSWIPLIEGMLMKRMNAPLKPCNRLDNNTDWQVKIRKPNKCYKF